MSKAIGNNINVTVRSLGDLVDLREIHGDERGHLVELFQYGNYSFFESNAKQINLFTVKPGQKRAGHKHPLTNETWVIVCGMGQLRLELPDGLKFCLDFEVEGEAIVVDLPAGTGHEVENTSTITDMIVVYDMDVFYDPENPDVEPWEWEEVTE